jgi:hypothetical protein
MAAGDDWGQSSVNNTNGFGKGAENNSISWGLIHGNSYGHPRTNLTGGGGFTGLFDQYGYPAFGASMRLLGANYTGGLVRVRAFDGASDQGTADVMPYKIGSEYWVDLNSTLENLDATATGRGLTASDTLGDLLSSGASNYDGFVTTWYDQSGNANDATQATAASQPQIASAGVLETLNGKPNVIFTSAQSLQFNSKIDLSPFANSAGFFVMRDSTSNDNNGFLINNSATKYLTLNYNSSNLYTWGTGNIVSATRNSTSQRLESATFEGVTTTVTIRNNGSLIGTETSASMSNAEADGILNAVRSSNVETQEVIIYSSNVLTSVNNIETNINNAFSIYP